MSSIEHFASTAFFAFAARAGAPRSLSRTMDQPLEACRLVFSSFDDGTGFVRLEHVAAVVLALERDYSEPQLQHTCSQLAARDDGALSFAGVCEVLSCVMRGAPRTADALTLLDPSGSRVRVTLADVAALQLKALYKRHPAFDDQQCWLAASTSHAAHCVADGEGLRSAFAHHPAAFTIRARNWLHGDVRKGGDTFEVRLRGNAPAAGAVVDNGDGSYSATYTATVTGTYALHVTLGRKHIHGPPPPRNSAPRNSAPRNSARVSDGTHP